MGTTVTYSDEAQHLGDNNFVQLTNLETAIEQIKKTLDRDEELIDIIEDLADLITQNPDRPVIGLENKLELGGRTDLFPRANRLKGRFARRVAKHQMSMSEQQVYIQILDAINTIWHSVIKPSITEGKSDSEIDALILDSLVSPIHQAIVRFDYTVTTELVSGMLYFLTGKCHVDWEAGC